MAQPRDDKTPVSIPLYDSKAEQAEIGHECQAAIQQVIESGSFILGPAVKQLETRLSEYVNVTAHPPIHCVSVASGTDALYLSLLALGVGPGDDVVTVPFTWISSAEIIPLVGANPVFADICPETYCLNTSSLERALTNRARAVIAVSLFGYIPDYAALREVIASAETKFGHSIALIEDAAQSFGSRRGGFASCASPYTTLATTSFFPSKPLGCYGDGGAVFTRSNSLAKAIESLRVHGKDPAIGLHTRVGVNSRLDTLQAAVLLAKLNHFPDFATRRTSRAQAYTRALSIDKRVIAPTAPQNMFHVYGVYTIRVQRRDDVAAYMKQRGVATAVYYRVCVHEQPAFRSLGFQNGETRSNSSCNLGIAEALSKQVLSLPIHAYLTDKDMNVVVSALLNALDHLGVTDPPTITTR